MKRILIAALVILVAFLLFAGCNTTRKMEASTNVQETNRTQIDRGKDSTAVSIRTDWDSIYWRMTENMKLTFHKVEYDTDKPVDSTTGKPPLKSEITGEIDLNRGASGGQESKSNAKDSIKISEQDHTAFDTNKSTVTKITTEKKNRASWGWLVGVVVIAGAGIGIWRLIKRAT